MNRRPNGEVFWDMTPVQKKAPRDNIAGPSVCQICKGICLSGSQEMLRAVVWTASAARSPDHRLHRVTTVQKDRRRRFGQIGQRRPVHTEQKRTDK